MFLDFLCSLFKKNEGAAQDNKSFIPPAHLIDGVGGGGEKMFVKVGEEFFGYFVEKGGLNPTDRILDIGCGCGRMAIPLLTYLKDPGEYWGFDIVQPAVQWAQERISPTFPKFHFHAIDVHNRLYNPKGRTPPGKFQFPYADDFFDFTFLTSVFTHMVAPEMRHYLAEIVRTLSLEDGASPPTSS